MKAITRLGLHRGLDVGAKLATLPSVAIKPDPAPRRHLRTWLAGLFEEAARFGRQRWSRLCLVLTGVTCAAAAIAMFDDGGSRSNAATPDAVPNAKLVSRTLPALGDFPMLSVAGGRLIVSDSENTGFEHGRVTGTCAGARIDPATLRAIRVVRGSCGDPTVFGERVIPVVYVPRSQSRAESGTNVLLMRIAAVDPAAADGFRVGPVIANYPDCSDCRAETIYGDGSLWVFESMTSLRSHFGVLLRVSQTTGRVVEHWRMPPITRALLAADADGLWITPSLESGFPMHVTRAQQLADTSLYRIAPGMRQPQRVFDIGLDGARWLAATDHIVWLDVGPVKGPDSPRLWRFDGPQATPTARGASTPGGTRVCGDLGDGPTTVLGSATGVYCVNTGSGRQSVAWLGRDGRSGAVLARTSTPTQWDFADNAVTDDGSYYFIDPPLTAASTLAGGGRDDTQPAIAAIVYRLTSRG